MSWLAASLIVLGLALVAGFAWYERSHPSSRVLALVATLAALAALGRIAFAPLPNVKPTTDIVLLTGYALGGAPGFAVGAVAALASNVFFGQGPWTPWQMCAWGGIGVAGALLARAFGRELGRASLAVACGLAGAFFGAVMNLSLWVTFSGSDHSLAKLGAYFVTSLPFDIAHVVGNVVFCLVFGPALVRALTRYRQRFEITWRPAPALAASVLAAVVLLAAAPRAAEAAPPLAWLQSAQNADGGFGGDAGQRSTGLYTGWAGLGFAAAGRNPRDVKRGGSDIVAYVRAHPKDISDLGEVVPHDPAAARGGRAAARRQPRPRQGAAGQAAPATARSPTASTRPRSRSSRCAPPAARATTAWSARAARWIAGQANGDGGFNFAGKGAASGIDDTGAALQALVAAGRKGTPTVRRAARFLARAPEPRRRLPAAARRRLQRPVDRVGDPGARRRRPQPGPPAAQRREVAGRLPALARDRERQGPLLAHQRPDARVGHRAGRRGAGPQAVPARARAAREDDREAGRDARPRPRRAAPKQPATPAGRGKPVKARAAPRRRYGPASGPRRPPISRRRCRTRRGLRAT